MTKKDTKVIKILKVAIAIASVIVLGITVLYMLELYGVKEISYFSKHFAIPTIFLIVGILAFLLPMANKENIRTDEKGDKLMPIIGVLLIICAFFSCMMSFIGK